MIRSDSDRLCAHLYTYLLEKRTYLHSLGARLLEERARLGLTQATVARELGIARRTQINYESGMRAPDATYLHELQRLGFDIDYLLNAVPALIGRFAHKVEESRANFSFQEDSSDVMRASIVAVLSTWFDANEPPADGRATTAADIQRIADAALVLAEVSKSTQEVEHHRASIVRLIQPPKA